MPFVRRTAVLVAVFALLVVSAPAGADTSRLSLNAYGAHLNNGAFFIQSGFQAPLRLPNEGFPGFALNFTVPQDFAGELSPVVEVLWETEEDECEVLVGANFLYRTRDGQPRDTGSAAGGLDPLDATTPHALNGHFMLLVAPPAGTTAQFRYEINPDQDFPALEPGDGVTFGLYRVATSDDDSCSGEAGISGVSLVYESLP